MRMSKTSRFACSVAMSLILSNVPAVAMAESGRTMIPTSVAVTELSRAESQRKISDELAKDDLRKALLDRGVSPDEVSTRLASLSDAELRQLAGQIDQARAGGDILFTILIVVLIIFLIKRI